MPVEPAACRQTNEEARMRAPPPSWPCRVANLTVSVVAKLLRPSIATDLCLLVGLAAFAGWVITRTFLDAHALFHDNHKFYGLFRDQLHAANTFGELALWYPHYQCGWPGYYYAFLGDLNCSSPVFMLHEFAFWAMGRLGWRFDTYFLTYVLYFGFEVPLLFLVATYSLARQWFRSRLVLAYVCIVSAFSPGVVLNTSDVGFLEPVAYGLFFVTAFVSWFRSPTRRRLILFGLSASVLATSLNYTFITWNVLFLPLVLACVVLSTRNGIPRLCLLLMEHSWSITLIIVTVAICALPNVITYFQNPDLVRSRISGNSYALDQMTVGNPLELLSASIPGIGMAFKEDTFHVVRSDREASGVAYLGLLCWPLAVVALLYARTTTRLVLLLLMSFFFGIVMLSPGSPFWFAVLSVPTPLRSNNHFADLTFRGGGFLILIYAAAIGLRAVTAAETRRQRRTLLIGLVVVVASSLAVHVALAGTGVLGYPVIGFALLLAGCFSCVIAWQQRDRQPQAMTAWLIPVLALLDVSTVTFLHMRGVLAKDPVVVRDESLPGGVGFVSTSDEYMNHLICDKRYLEILKMGVDPHQFPTVAMFQRAHVEKDARQEIEVYVDALRNNRVASLCLDKDSALRPAFEEFVDAEAVGPARVEINVERATYNTLTVAVQAEGKALLYFNDGYSPHWKATVDDAPVHVARALVRGKAIVVPAGRHSVKFTFEPPWIRLALAVSYAVLVIYVVIYLFVLCWDTCVMRLRVAS